MREIEALRKKVEVGISSRTEVLSGLVLIERAIADRYMELPLDASEQPIHVGDTMVVVADQLEEYGDVITVGAIGANDKGGTYVYPAGDDVVPDGAVTVNALRHHNEITVEEILAAVASTAKEAEYQEEIDDAIARYAELLAIRTGV